MDPLLIVLDLDETLVHATSTPVDRPCDFRCDRFYVYLRPGLARFLQGIQAGFDVAVWTSASKDYAQCVIRNAFPHGYPLTFVWSRDRCTFRSDPETRENYWLKNVHKLKRQRYHLRRVLCIDDSPEKYHRSYGNYIRVPKYRGEVADDILARLLEYLGTLREVTDVRRVEKRGWLSAVAPKGETIS
jgi:RNA polymerase II subunit A small phosphatase-like protein